MNNQRQIQPIKQRTKQRIEKVPWKQQLTQLYIMLQYANLNLTNQNVMSADFLLLHQPQFPQLLKMVKSDAGTAKMQGTLNLTYTNRLTVF